MPLRIDVLGTFQVTCDGIEMRPRGRKARGLLAFLAVTPGHAISRERAADLLWSDRGAEQARGSLRQTLAELRTLHPAVSEAIGMAHDIIALAPARFETDVEQVHAAVRAYDAPAVAVALEAADIFLADLTGLSPAFEEWLAMERVRQTERLVHAVVATLPAMLGSASSPAIQAILRSLDRLDPWNEEVARLGMEVDAAAGDMASLHKRYRRLIAGLKADFGIAPSEDTRLLFDRLTSVSRADLEAPVGSAETAPPMVLVAPIEVIGGDPAAAELAAIATDDIRTALRQHVDIRVLAIERQDLDRVTRICRGSIAAYMLSGRLRRLGDDIRFNLQIGSVSSGAIVWSTQIKIDTAALASAIDAVVEQAVGAVLPAIDHDLGTRVSLASFARDDAVTLYARARRLVGRGHDLAETREGVRLLEEVVQRDPRHVGGMMLLARMYNNDLWQRVAGHDVAAFRARALTLTEQAATLAADDRHIQLRLSWCHLRRQGWLQAERGFARAAERLAYDADAQDQCALGFAALGRLDLAEPLIQRAFRLNPFAPADYHADRAMLLMLAGEAGEAEQHFALSLDGSPLYLYARLINMIRLPKLARECPALAASFTAAFARAWQPTRPATSADVRIWIADVFPLRLPEHVSRLTDDLSLALGEAWQATPSNACLAEAGVEVARNRCL